jgi:hypothetical protein
MDGLLEIALIGTIAIVGISSLVIVVRRVAAREKYAAAFWGLER